MFRAFFGIFVSSLVSIFLIKHITSVRILVFVLKLAKLLPETDKSLMGQLLDIGFVYYETLLRTPRQPHLQFTSERKLVLWSDKKRFSWFLCFVADIDDCANHPCNNGGTCVDIVNGYTCKCIDGYTGKNCNIGKSKMFLVQK